MSLDEFYRNLAGEIDSVQGLRGFALEGETVGADIAELITNVEVEATIEGAGTVTLTVADPDYKVLRSKLAKERTTCQVGDYAYELAQVKKQGRMLTLTFEDLVVAALRRHDDPIKIEAGVMTHVDFARKLVSEEPWVIFDTWPGLAEVSKDELARGEPYQSGEDKLAEREAKKAAKPGAVTITPEMIAMGITPPPASSSTPKVPKATAEKREDTWKALGRIADDRGWRRYVRNGNMVTYIPETFLFLSDPTFEFDEEGRNGVDTIDYDWDIGKPSATCTVTLRMGRNWVILPGQTVQVKNSGVADGKWLVASVKRSLFSYEATVSLVQPRPTLPEPEGPDNSADVEDGSLMDEGLDLGMGVDMGAVPVDNPEPFGENAYNRTVEDQAWAWPTTIRRITSPFGPRSAGVGASTQHKGIDIGVPMLTPVFAAREGTVTFAGEQSGYGNVVYIQHTSEPTYFVTRYAHLSDIAVRRGMRIKKGGRVGRSGGLPGWPGAGNSKAPHLHFEIRGARGAALNPTDYLPKVQAPAPTRHSGGGVYVL